MLLYMSQLLDVLLNSRDRQLIEDDHYSRRHVDTCTDDDFNVQDIIQTDWRLNIRYVADCLKFWYSTVQALWVPQIVNAWNQASLTGNFLWKSLSIVGIFCQVSPKTIYHGYDLAHHFDSKTMLQSKQWKHVTLLIPVERRKTAQQGKLWHPYFGIVREYCWLTAWSEKRL